MLLKSFLRIWLQLSSFLINQAYYRNYLLKKVFVATSFIYRIMHLSVNFNFVMFSTLFLLLMLSTLQRKENRLIEQTVFFYYMNHHSMLFMHTNVFYTKKDQHDFTHIDLFLIALFNSCCATTIKLKVLIFRVCHRVSAQDFLVLLKGVYRVFFA